MHIDVAINQLEDLISYFKTYKETRFASAMILYIVDQFISSIQSRFENFQIYENIFGFLFNFKKLKSLDDDSLQSKCLNIEGFLKHDFNGLDLFSKLKVLKNKIYK
jgi:hypothetical protein